MDGDVRFAPSKAGVGLLASGYSTDPRRVGSHRRPVLPGESPAVFGDALRRLSSAATFLYHDGTRYWYSTQPTVTKLADDRAEQFKRERDQAYREIERRIRVDVKKAGEFTGVHPLPSTSHDVPDEMSTRLVVLSLA